MQLGVKLLSQLYS